MRGCFLKSPSNQKDFSVLPAYAGMFPQIPRSVFDRSRSPRVCGDVSKIQEENLKQAKFSPRMRGCFRRIKNLKFRIEVLPAYAGMFPALVDSSR